MCIRWLIYFHLCMHVLAQFVSIINDEYRTERKCTKIFTKPANSTHRASVKKNNEILWILFNNNNRQITIHVEAGPAFVWSARVCYVDEARSMSKSERMSVHAVTDFFLCTVKTFFFSFASDACMQKTATNSLFEFNSESIDISWKFSARLCSSDANANDETIYI